jgi:hypothetical protein
MDRRRLQDLIAAYGAEPERWPAAERDQARALATFSDLADAAALDRVLDAFTLAAPGLELRRRVLAGAPKQRNVRAIWPAWLSGLGLAAACAAGLVVGSQLGGSADTSVASPDIAAFGTETVFGQPIEADRNG